MNIQSQSIISEKNKTDTSSLSEKSLGMAYVPWQQDFGNVYDLDKAFCKGTIFPCLDKPFLGRSGCK